MNYTASGIVRACSVLSDSAAPRTVSTRLLCPWDFPGKNIGVGCYFLLQRIVPTQGSNLCLLCILHCRWILYQQCHLGSPVEQQDLKKQTNSTKCWWECGGTGTLIHCRGKSKMAQALQKIVLTVFIKLNIHLLCDSTVPLWGIDSREWKFIFIQKHTWMLIAALFINTKSQRWPKYSSVGEWINKPHTLEKPMCRSGSNS